MKAWIELPTDPDLPTPRGLQHRDGEAVLVRTAGGRGSEVAYYSDGPHARCYLGPDGEPLDVVAVWGDPTVDHAVSDPDREREEDE
jgi:hypothetical protein